MDLQDPKVQRLLLSVLVSAVVLYGFFGTSLAPFTYASRSAEIAELETKHQQLTRDLERARLTVGNAAKLEREFDFLHRQWLVAQSLLPDEDEISGLVRKVSAAGTQAGLEWVRFEPQPAMAQGFYRENPIEVELEGGYHQVGTFLSSLSNVGRILNVRSLLMEGVDAKKQGEPEIDHTLAVSMEVVAYTIDKAALAAPPDAGDGTKQIDTASTTNAFDVQASTDVVPTEEEAR